MVVDTTSGPKYGEMIIHPTLEGKIGLDAKDADGKLIVKDSIAAKTGIKTYNWKNLGENFAREKVATFDTYENWRWLVFGSSYVDELNQSARVLSRNLTIATLLCGLLLADYSIGCSSARSVSRLPMQWQLPQAWQPAILRRKS